jgi:hypothetical protein
MNGMTFALRASIALLRIWQTKSWLPSKVNPSRSHHPIRLSLTLGPEARLPTLCANLTQQARGRRCSKYAQLHRRSVAVPFLDQLLGSEEPNISRSALKGLIRIGNDGAIDAMIRNLNVVRDSALKKTIVEALTTKEAEARNNGQQRVRIHAALAKHEKGVSEW